MENVGNSCKNLFRVERFNPIWYPGIRLYSKLCTIYLVTSFFIQSMLFLAFFYIFVQHTCKNLSFFERFIFDTAVTAIFLQTAGKKKNIHFTIVKFSLDIKFEVN